MPYIYVDFSDPIGDYFEATSAQFSVNQPQFSGGISTRAQRDDFACTKDVGHMSKALFSHCAKGTRFDWVCVSFYPGSNTGMTVLYTMTDVYIASISATAKSEALGFSFGGYEAEYYKDYD